MHGRLRVLIRSALCLLLAAAGAISVSLLSIQAEAQSRGIEVVLRSFSVDEEAHFMTKWKEDSESFKVPRFNLYIEDWEGDAIASGGHGRLGKRGKFRSNDKYRGIVVHDKDDEGAKPYDEVRRISAVVRDKDDGVLVAITQLLRSVSDPSLVAEAEENNQPYFIDAELHKLIKAGLLVKEGKGTRIPIDKNGAVVELA